MKNKFQIQSIVYLRAVILAVICLYCFTSCSAFTHSEQASETDMTYIPEFIEVNEEKVYWDIQLSGEYIYYPSWTPGEKTEGIWECLNKYHLTDGKTSLIYLDWKGGIIYTYTVTEEGNIWLLSEDTGIMQKKDNTAAARQMLYQFDSTGKQLFSQDVTEQLSESYLTVMETDHYGRLYIGAESTVWLYDENGELHGSILLETSDGRITGINCSKEDDIYAVYLDGESGQNNSNGHGIAKLDFKTCTVSGYDMELPWSELCNSEGEEDFLVSDHDGVYTYDLKSHSAAPLFHWADCNIDGSYARVLGRIKDGRIAVVCKDWPDDRNEIALLTEVPAEQIAPKEILVLAAMSDTGELQSMATRFNKASRQYQIIIREYYNKADGNSWMDAFMKLEADLLSQEPPDIIDLTDMDLEKFSSADILEDLGSFLDNGQGLKRQDILESILDAFTFQGKLAGLPSRFYIRTVVGGSVEQPWNLEAVMAFADSHPEAELFGGETKRSVMEYLMRFNEGTFIDWQNGECCFQSEQFLHLLEFVNRFPTESKPEADALPTPVKVQNGEVLLMAASITDFDFLQLYQEIYHGNAYCVGYPTADGSNGHELCLDSRVYGIAANSKNKEGAWEFIEYFLTQKDGRYNNYSFPVTKDKLDIMIRKCLHAGYLVDDEGFLLLDENLEPIADADFKTTTYGNGGSQHWDYTYGAAGQDEIDNVLAVMNAARLPSEADNAILNIITEEAEAFYRGQKTAQETAAIIQSRISIYVSERY